VLEGLRIGTCKLLKKSFKMAGRKKKEMGGKKVGQIGARMFKWKKKSLFDYCTI